MRTHSECIANVLREFFIEREDGFCSDRIEKEITEYSVKSDKAKASAKARWDKQRVSEDANALQTDCERNAKHKPLTTNHKPVTKEKKAVKKTGFTKPTFEAVNDYANEKGLNISGFFDYYESNGWKVGKNAMKDWQASARGWSGRQGNFSGKGKPVKQKPERNWDAITGGTNKKTIEGEFTRE